MTKKRVKFILGDGSKGCRDEAPFDRILCSASLRDSLPSSWREQLKEGGIIVDNNGEPIEIETGYTRDQLADLNYTQSADILYLAHSAHRPSKLERYSHTDWKFSEIENGYPKY